MEDETQREAQLICGVGTAVVDATDGASRDVHRGVAVCPSLPDWRMPPVTEKLAGDSLRWAVVKRLLGLVLRCSRRVW